jgi:hypothetical protein
MENDIPIAIAKYEKAMSADATLGDSANNLAWLHAVVPAIKFRDGQKAVAYAQKAVSNLSKRRLDRETKALLGTLLRFYRQAAGTFTDCRATRGQRLRRHLGTEAPLHRADDWGIFHSVRVCHGDEALLRAQAIDHSLLPSAEHGVRKNGKVTEHPKKINALKKRGHHVTRPDRGLHLDHTV